jgi:uroporphyrinogen-III synthase
LEDKEKIIISTLMPDQFSKFEKFMGKGFKLMNFPMITIENLEPDENAHIVLSNINRFNWLIFTSMRGVSGFYNFLHKTKIKAKDLNLKTACIGQSTAIEVKFLGLQPNYINPGNTSEEFADFLIKETLHSNDKVLLIQGERADNQFENKLKKYCQTERLNVYKTKDVGTFNENLKEILDANSYELIIFTSPSGFESFLNIYNYQATEIQLKIATIGMKTTKAIENLGFQVILTAEKSNLEGLAEEVVTYFKV